MKSNSTVINIIIIISFFTLGKYNPEGWQKLGQLQREN